MTGFPALTVPAGFTTDALPVGLEFLGRPFTEAMLLNFAYAYEQATRASQAAAAHASSCKRVAVTRSRIRQGAVSISTAKLANQRVPE